MKKYLLTISIFIISFWFLGIFAVRAEALYRPPVDANPSTWTDRWYNLKGSSAHVNNNLYAVDLNLKEGDDYGEPIYAIADGTITGGYNNDVTGYGQHIYIEHIGPGNKKYTAVYAHFSAYNRNFSIHSAVKKGDVVGYLGNTGNSSGPHLHFGMWESGTFLPFNPLPYMEGGDKLENRGTAFATLLSWADKISSWTFPAAAPIKVEKLDVQKEFGGMVATAFNWALGVGAVLAFAIITYGGLLYTMSMGNVGRMKDAKEWITAAIFGLALLFGGWLLLYSINPCIVGAC